MRKPSSVWMCEVELFGISRLNFRFVRTKTQKKIQNFKNPCKFTAKIGDLVRFLYTLDTVCHGNYYRLGFSKVYMRF